MLETAGSVSILVSAKIPLLMRTKLVLSAAVPSQSETYPTDKLISTITVRSLDALIPHISPWDQLAWKAPQKIPNLLPAWIDAFLRHRLTPNERWFCSFAYFGDRLVGVLPIIVTPHVLLGSAWPILRTPFDVHTPSGDVLLDPDYAAAAFKALMTELCSQVPNHLGLDLKAVRSSSSLWQALEDGVDGYVIHRGMRSKWSRLDVDGDFNAYQASLGKIRENVRRGRRKLERRGVVSIEMRKGSDASEEFFAEFLALEASGWKGRNRTAMLNDTNVVAFYTTLIRNFAAQGYWEWHAIRVDGQLVVAGMGVRCGAGLMLPKYAFNEDFADCVPGSLLIGEIVKDAFSRPDLDEINPMSKSAPDRFWRMSEDGYTDVHLIRQGILPMLLQLPHVALRSAYQDHIRPRIPTVLKETHRKFRRRGDRKPSRAASASR
jgi:hypothetical protein